MSLYRDILPYVRKPSRYLGKEINAIRKDITATRTRVALVFPDLYEIGMSHLGLRILYHILNKRPDIAAERVFAPDLDYEYTLKTRGLPLASLESSLPLNQFHIIGFSLQYELTFTNVLNILRLGNIPLKSSERDRDCPLIIAGGSCVTNPEPLADFIDAFVLGDGEEAALEIVEIYQEWLESRAPKDELLDRLSRLEGVYIPFLFKVDYRPDKEIQGITPQRKEYTAIRKRVLKDLDSSEYPVSPVIPFTKIIHDRINIEVARGCLRKCRFCQASKIHSPYRARSTESIFYLAEESLENTGYEELALTSLNICDFKNLDFVIRHLMERLSKKRVALSLPSLMIGTLDSEIIREIQRVRKTGFTLVPEAATERLRRVISKDMSEDQFMRDVEQIIKAGWNSLKLYFMVGLPTEDEQDIDGIIDLSYKVLHRVREHKGRVKQISVSVSSFVPKPHTPFQWFPQQESDLLGKKMGSLKSRLKNRRFTFKGHPVKMSFLEAVFSRGDRRLGEVLIKALDRGCKFDGWKEHFNYQAWLDSFSDSGIDPKFYANRRIDLSSILPWQHLYTGTSCDYLKDEYRAVDRDTLSPVKTGTDYHEKGRGIQEGKERSGKDKGENEIPVQKIRVRYEKLHDMSFLSHLDLVRVFQRALRRARVPLAYSLGFHPRPKISFGMALPIGIESTCEYLDAELSSYREPHGFLSDVNKELPSGLRILSAKNIPLKSSNIFNITEKVIYSVILKMSSSKKDLTIDGYNRVIEVFLSNSKILIEKKRDSDTKRVDIKPLIESMRAIEKNGMIDLELIIKVRESDNVRPDEIIKELSKSEKMDMNVLSIKKVGISLKEEL